MSGDPGLGWERTGLAWQRTALSLLLVSAVLLRLRYDDLGHRALLGAGSACTLAAWVLVEARTRMRRNDPAARRRGGRSTAALSTATAALAVAELVVLTRD